jgi:hypothetical protein
MKGGGAERPPTQPDPGAPRQAMKPGHTFLCKMTRKKDRKGNDILIGEIGGVARFVAFRGRDDRFDNEVFYLWLSQHPDFIVHGTEGAEIRDD